MTTYPEPVWTTPSDQYVRTQSVFDQQPVDVEALTALLIRFLQYCFIDADNIVDPGLKTLLWKSDAKTTDIFIGAGYSENHKVAGQKPAIYVTREDIKPLQPNISPTYVQVSIGTSVPDPTKYNRLLSGGYQIRVESKYAYEAEAIGLEIYRKLVFFETCLTAESRMWELTTLALSKVQKTETGNFATAVQMSWAVNFWYSIPHIDAW